MENMSQEESKRRASIKYRNSPKGQLKRKQQRDALKQRFPTYQIYRAMVQRCNNPKSCGYAYYGGRGIKVCDRWLNSFDNFLIDMGDKPTSSHTLDRLDTNGNYEPLNCRWATRIEQMRNTRRNVYVEFNGEKLTVAELASRHNISQECLNQRIKRGFSLEEAVSRPVRKYLYKNGGSGV